MCGRIDGLEHDLFAGGIVREAIAARPVARGSDGALRKAAAAVRADVRQDAINATATERTFIRTDHGVRCLGRQQLVAVFAGGPKG